jgi:hypothetical protein
MNYTDFELIQMQAEVLYVHDRQHRLVRLNESDAEHPAPRFFLSRSLTGNIWRVRDDLPDDLAAELGRFAADEPLVDDLSDPPYYLAAYTELLEQHAPLESTWAGPSYYLPELDPPRGTVLITPANKGVLEVEFPWTLSTLDERSPIVTVVEDGMAVAACFTARSTTHAAEAGVHTLEAYRGRGYAPEMVRGWAAAVRMRGRQPLYSTSWSNTASQAVAAKLGAVLYGATFCIT